VRSVINDNVALQYTWAASKRTNKRLSWLVRSAPGCSLLRLTPSAEFSPDGKYSRILASDGKLSKLAARDHSDAPDFDASLTARKSATPTRSHPF
jgi:hypothetical protein